VSELSVGGCILWAAVVVIGFILVLVAAYMVGFSITGGILSAKSAHRKRTQAEEGQGSSYGKR
jgi:hypothetical protein